MMNIWRFIHTTCLFTYVVCWIGKFHNVSDVARQYVEFCGANTLCSTNNGEDEMNESMMEEDKFSTICPSCSCVKQCYILGNCCPDIALSTCIPTKHQIHDLNNVSDVFHNVVSRCPIENEISEPKPCLFSFTLTNFLTQIPVTSTKTKISYASKTCAECHGENQIVSWSFDVSCPDIPIDPSVFSGFSELMSGMQERSCTVNLQPPLNYKAQSCNKETTIGKCNVTGLWDRRDGDLETACLNYWRPYGAFQNVFCFLCNIDAALREQFSLKQTINETISHVDESGKLCGIQNENCIQRESHKSMTLTDAQIIISESFESKNGDYIANIDFLSSNLPTKMQKVILSKRISNTTSPDNPVDLKSLYMEYLSSGGYQDWCNEDYKKEKIYPALKGKRTCSCARDCYLTMSCCPDAAYNHIWSCILPTMGETPKMASIQPVFLISRCPVGYEDEFVKFSCEESDDFDTLHIPVINLREKKVYKNSYCFLCSDKADVINESIAYMKPWNLSLVCPHVFFPRFFKSMESIFDYADQINCFINFKTSFHIDTCNINPTIDKCNVTGLATSVSKNSIALCENPAMTIMTQSKNTMYRNIICDLCNSEFLEDPISQCNVTGNWKIDVLDVRQGAKFYKRRCVNKIYDPKKYPFKNKYCKTCNDYHINQSDDRSIIHAGDSKTSYRQLFSISEVPRHDKAVSVDSCNEAEMYDPYKKKCRKLRCSPGKFLHHGVCIPLINEVKALQYALAFKTLITYEIEILNGLYYMLYTFIEYLRLDNVSLTMESLQTHFYVRKPCHFLKNPDLNSTTEALVYIEIKIRKFDEKKKLNRTNIEKKLLNFTEWDNQIGGNSIQFEESVEAWYLPLRKRMTNSRTECVVHNYQTEEGVSVESLHTFDVNKLLVCPQIELDSSEYEFANNRLEVFLPEIERNFFVNEFIENDNGTIQICVDSYSYIFTSSERSTTLQTVLTIVTLVVTILSLLCSFLTFVTYCTLPILRTVPGKNIMCFSFSLFFAQLLFLVRSYIDNKLGCMLVGSLTHYFWISVFVCTNVCCFHMFKLFVGSSLVHGDKTSEWKLICRYCGMSYVLPILPVVINIYFNHEQIYVDGNNFGYGGNKCFLVSSLALLLTFIAPIALQILFNIILFSITFHFIRNTPKVQSSQDRDDFSIFLKLFLLTGISWLFMVVDGFFEMSLFSFLVTFLNGSQGAFLFLSFICNKKVWIMLKKKFNKAPPQTTCKFESTCTRSNRDYKAHSNYPEVTVATGTLEETQTSNDLNSI